MAERQDATGAIPRNWESKERELSVGRVREDVLGTVARDGLRGLVNFHVGGRRGNREGSRRHRMSRGNTNSCSYSLTPASHLLLCLITTLMLTVVIPLAPPMSENTEVQR